MNSNTIKTHEIREKNLVALSSVLAAVFLTGSKLTIGLLTNSLGILSEALHSGLDLVAALITFFAVRIADKPADDDHPFGHGKVENFSALIETLLLLITCIWIIYEAVDRLAGSHATIEVTHWSFIVIFSSIIIDFSRSRALSRVAKKYNSQALEADALHFSSDILSSLVVVIGLIGTKFGYLFADPIAALFVALIVIGISFKLGKRAIDALMDHSDKKISDLILRIGKTIPEVIHIHDIKTRTSGSHYLVELNIHVNPELTIDEAHKISHKYEDCISKEIERCIVHVHIEPDNRDE